jgi:hypothetical protein
MKIALALLAVLALVLAALMLRPGASLRAAFDERRAALRPAASGAPVTEARISHLPPPVQAWLRRAGVLGKPPVTMVHTFFTATLHSAPGDAGMTGPAEQIDVIDPPRRLFFMSTRMYGLPVAVLHDWSGDQGGMTVRLARLFNLVDTGGEAFARAETVTFLNDLCAYAPSALARPEFSWEEIDARSARVRYTRGGVTVSATLFFNAEGDLADFSSDDRAELMPDGSLRSLRWTTPLSGFREAHGRRVPGRGEAIWHRPEGPFTYGVFDLAEVRFTGG